MPPIKNESHSSSNWFLIGKNWLNGMNNRLSKHTIKVEKDYI